MVGVHLNLSCFSVFATCRLESTELPGKVRILRGKDGKGISGQTSNHDPLSDSEKRYKKFHHVRQNVPTIWLLLSWISEERNRVESTSEPSRKRGR